MILTVLHIWCLAEVFKVVSSFVTSPLAPIPRHPRTFFFLSSESISTESSSKEASMIFPTPEVLKNVLCVAEEAAKKAGCIILGNAGGVEISDRKANSRDLLTLIDPLCEKTIKETILATFPDHDFLGEEDVPPGKSASAAAIEEKLQNSKSDWLWIVDPIDGTTNFANGIP
jgi:hypothetical protein